MEDRYSLAAIVGSKRLIGTRVIQHRGREALLVEAISTNASHRPGQVGVLHMWQPQTKFAREDQWVGLSCSRCIMHHHVSSNDLSYALTSSRHSDEHPIITGYIMLYDPSYLDIVLGGHSESIGGISHSHCRNKLGITGISKLKTMLHLIT